MLTFSGKLREGVIASGRLDEFTIEVFEESVRYAILARDQAQLHSALHGLVPDLYMKVDEKIKREGSSHDSVPYVVRHIRSLSLSNGKGRKDNREYFSSLLLIYHLVHSTREAYHCRRCRYFDLSRCRWTRWTSLTDPALNHHHRFKRRKGQRSRSSRPSRSRSLGQQLMRWPLSG